MSVSVSPKSDVYYPNITKFFMHIACGAG